MYSKTFECGMTVEYGGHLTAINGAALTEVNWFINPHTGECIDEAAAESCANRTHAESCANPDCRAKLGY